MTFKVLYFHLEETCAESTLEWVLFLIYLG